ncbi:MAG: AraC family transcriptional regulator [Desulfarculales bacterium]|jgi:AraC-like DNA-binding protein|nr:AraC family transcriptional regulator [Desulfarculales bacterium]
MINDPFSDILRLAKVQPMISGGFTAGGSWALRFPKPEQIKFFALVKGGCWLMIDGQKEVVRVGEGDVFLLKIQKPFVLASDFEAEPIDAVSLFAGKANKTAAIGNSADWVQIGGHVKLDASSGEILGHILPPLIHVPATSPRAASLKILLDQLVRERETELPGEQLVSSNLAQLLFVQILRVYMESSAPLPPGWLRAVSDKRLAPVLRLMHGNPARSWQLGELAKEAAMSRTAFAVHFKAVAGVPPLTYLTEWRMRLAKQALREEDTPISVLAGLLGYTSESAFSNAFKRLIGISPTRYRSSSPETDGRHDTESRRVHMDMRLE